MSKNTILRPLSNSERSNLAERVATQAVMAWDIDDLIAYANERMIQDCESLDDNDLIAMADDVLGTVDGE